MNPPDRPKLQCLGMPLFDVDSRVVNPEILEEVGVREDGEIVSSGPQVMKGYWNRPEAGEEAFSERDGKRFLRTGDIGIRDEEGYFFMVDRLKRVINVSSYSVWPAEVESTLYEHPSIQEAVVIAIPDERSGEVARAMVVLEEEEKGKASEEEIVEWAKGRMATYKYPRSVEYYRRVAQERVRQDPLARASGERAGEDSGGEIDQGKRTKYGKTQKRGSRWRTETQGKP
jgi:fatty-acyl-CoA synthase